MAHNPDHYKVLEISPKATQQEIKQAYRRLAKAFHPDTCTDDLHQDRMIEINNAYEILGDVQQRQRYDASRDAVHFRGIRSAQGVSVQPRRTSETDLNLWLRQIYRPLAQSIKQMILALDREIEDLSADPFDDELMATFQDYIEHSKILLSRSQQLFESLPNPATTARAARDLYYCLNHLGDGLEQLEWFTLNYNEDYLHSGQELFRRAAQFSIQAHQAIAQLH